MPKLPRSIPNVLDVILPDQQTCPVIVTIPHSGRHYRDDFVQQTQLSNIDIRRSEDAYVDKLFADAPLYGLPILKALFPRAFIDVNREPYELDPNLFETPLPSYINTTSPRAYVGLGTIPSIVTHNLKIYGEKLCLNEVLGRIDNYYYPYHANLEALIATTKNKFKMSIILDCHSMPSPRHLGQFLPDFILGDLFGTTCDPQLVSWVTEYLSSSGYSVGRNTPYAGAYIMKQYGKPNDNAHAIQLEIRRSLYMDEHTMKPQKGLSKIKNLMNGLIEHICICLEREDIKIS